MENNHRATWYAALQRHWAHDPSAWALHERGTHLDAGLLFCRDNNFAPARASATRAFRAAFGETFPLRDGIRADTFACVPVLSDLFAALVFRTTPSAYGVVTFRGERGVPPVLMTFSLSFYEALAVFAATLYGSPYHDTPLAPRRTFDALFAALADDRRWSWDSQFTAPPRRSPHLSWLPPNRHDRVLLSTEQVDTAMLELVVPFAATREEEEAFATRLHALTVGRVPILNGRAAADDSTTTYELRLARGWFADASPVASPHFAYRLPFEASEDALRAAILDLRTAASDIPVFSFPLGFHARAGVDVLAAAARGEAPAVPANESDELATLRRDLAAARADADQLRRDLLDARSSRDRFRDLVGTLRAERRDLLPLDEHNEEPCPPAPDAPAIEAAPILPSAPLSLPVQWRDADTLLAWLHERYGPRIVFHPRVRASLADAPTTLDERALADILDILGRDYLAMMDGDADARARKRLGLIENHLANLDYSIDILARACAIEAQG